LRNVRRYAKAILLICSRKVSGGVELNNKNCLRQMKRKAESNLIVAVTSAENIP